MRYSWLDVVLYGIAVVLLIPLVVQMVETLAKILNGTG